MRGGARTGAGRHGFSLQHHWLRGTYRKDRHGPLPPGGVPAPPEPLFDWQPTEEELGRLQADGQRFIAAALEKREFNFLAGRILLMLADTLDQMRVLREDIDRRGVVLTGPRGGPRVNPAVKQHLQAVKWFGQLSKQLDLR